MTFVDRDRACAILPRVTPDPLPFIALMGAGFVIGVLGHLYKSRATIAAGIGIIFVATLVPLGVYLSDR